VEIYGKNIDPIEVRRHIGMVFQKPNPFPKSIYDNIAYGPRVIGMKVDDMDAHVEETLRSAALWEEARKALQSAVTTRQQYPYRFRTERRVRQLDPTTLTVRREFESKVPGQRCTKDIEAQIAEPMQRISRDVRAQMWFGAIAPGAGTARPE